MSCSTLLTRDSRDNGFTSACPYTLSAVLKKQIFIETCAGAVTNCVSLNGVEWTLILLSLKFSYIIFKNAVPTSQKTLPLHYKDQLVDTLEGNNGTLF
jgi:hypothetical protein